MEQLVRLPRIDLRTFRFVDKRPILILGWHCGETRDYIYLVSVVVLFVKDKFIGPRND